MGINQGFRSMSAINSFSHLYTSFRILGLIEKKLCNFVSVVFGLWSGFFNLSLSKVNRDYPVNRGWKPLPPTTNYSLNNIEFYVASHERRRWSEKRPV